METIQPHDDALVVTLQIARFDVKRVMIDQDGGAEIMYPNLFKGLGLKLEDLDQYDAPLIGFCGNTIIPKGMIWLPVQTGDKVVKVNFIVVDAFSPYTAILAKPWLHAMGVVSSILHVKAKYPTRERVAELVGCQSMARQCMVAAINHHIVEDADRYFQIGIQLPMQDKKQLVDFLKDNLDVCMECL